MSGRLGLGLVGTVLRLSLVWVIELLGLFSAAHG